MIMEGMERLMTLADLSDMLGVPVNTLYGWRVRRRGPGRLPGWPARPVSPDGGRGLAGDADRSRTHDTLIMAYIERREVQQRDRSGRLKMVVRYKVRYRDWAGKPHSETSGGWLTRSGVRRRSRPN